MCQFRVIVSLVLDLGWEHMGGDLRSYENCTLLLSSEEKVRKKTTEGVCYIPWKQPVRFIFTISCRSEASYVDQGLVVSPSIRLLFLRLDSSH